MSHILATGRTSESMPPGENLRYVGIANEDYKNVSNLQGPSQMGSVDVSMHDHSASAADD